MGFLGKVLGGALVGGLLGLAGRGSYKPKISKVPLSPMPEFLRQAQENYFKTAGNWLAGYGSLFPGMVNTALQGAREAGLTPAFVGITPFGALPLGRLTQRAILANTAQELGMLKFLKLAMQPYEWAEQTMYNYEKLRRQHPYVTYRKPSDLALFLHGAMSGAMPFINAGMFGGGSSPPPPALPGVNYTPVEQPGIIAQYGYTGKVPEF